MVKLIFSDIDGTLVHKNGEYANLIQVPEENRYISKNSLSVLRNIKYKALFVLITGRRRSGYERLAALIPHSHAIIEHGCIILSEDKPDSRWANVIKETVGELGSYKGLLWEYVRHLEKEGYKIDYRGRLASARVFVDKPENLTEEEKAKIEKMVERDVGHLLTTTRNQEMIDIIPRAGGKIKAAHFLLSKYSISLEDTAALGDDFNDKDMLSSVGFPLCPGNAILEIKNVVKHRNGYVSQYSYHNGTADILREVSYHV